MNSEMLLDKNLLYSFRISLAETLIFYFFRKNSAMMIEMYNPKSVQAILIYIYPYILKEIISPKVWSAIRSSRIVRNL